MRNITTLSPLFESNIVSFDIFFLFDTIQWGILFINPGPINYCMGCWNRRRKTVGWPRLSVSLTKPWLSTCYQQVGEPLKRVSYATLVATSHYPVPPNSSCDVICWLDPMEIDWLVKVIHLLRRITVTAAHCSCCRVFEAADSRNSGPMLLILSSYLNRVKLESQERSSVSSYVITSGFSLDWTLESARRMM